MPVIGGCDLGPWMGDVNAVLWMGDLPGGCAWGMCLGAVTGVCDCGLWLGTVAGGIANDRQPDEPRENMIIFGN